jgi:choline-sulfatase
MNSESPPNILILMADEFRFDLPGFMGNPVCRTPHLDQLARDAVIFDNAYTPSPVCVPARQCLATGKYPLHIGCEYFGDDIAPQSSTFSRQFSEEGYLTVACGKLHHRGPDQMQGWMQRIGGECALNWPPTPANKSRGQIGRLKWRGASELHQAGPGLSPTTIQDRYTVDGAVAWMQMHFGGMYQRDPSPLAPALLMVSLQQPHFPFLADPERVKYYKDRIHARTQEEADFHPVLGADALPCGADVSEDEIKNATAAYYSLAEQADSEFGRVLRAIEDHGQDLDDWTIIFTADHGEMLGEHALWGKRKFFEGSVRVPFFIRSPRRFEAAKRRENVNLVDIFPTLCDLTGFSAPEDLDGRSLTALLRGDAVGWQNDTFSQYEADQFMLKRGNLKYLTFGEWGPDVLFDLASDPGETTNRIGELSYATQAADMKTCLQLFIASRRDG